MRCYFDPDIIRLLTVWRLLAVGVRFSYSFTKGRVWFRISIHQVSIHQVSIHHVNIHQRRTNGRGREKTTPQAVV